MKENYWDTLLRRRLSRRRLIRGTLAGVGTVALLGCAPAAPKPAPTKPAAVPGSPTPSLQPVMGGRLRIASTATLSEDPLLQLGGNLDGVVRNNMYDNLIWIDPKGKHVPSLAESWEIPEPDRVVFKLRKGVKLHDGVPLNAQLMKFNYERIMDPATKATSAPFVGQSVKSVEPVDEYTVAYKLPAPSAGFLAIVAGDHFVSPVSPEAVKKFNNDLKRNGVGTGSFQHSEWFQDDHITLRKFAGYWKSGVPYLDELYVKVIPDPTVSITMLRTGEIDFMAQMQSKDVLELKNDPNIKVPGGPVPVLRGLSINSKKAPFNNKALRQAAAYAIDREAIQQGVYLGLAPVAYGHYSPSYWFYDPAIEQMYRFDLDKARAKLKEGGSPDGFEVEALVSGGVPDLIPLGEAVQGQLAKVGIKIKLKTVEYAVFLDSWKKGDFQALIGRTSTGVDPYYYSIYDTLSSAPYNNQMVPNPEFDALMKKADATYDATERGRIYNELNRKMVEDVYWMLPIMHGANYVAHSTKVQGYVPAMTDNRWYFEGVWKVK
ncbi:MAG: ABC transporter substrate-binding protein [Chloroflexi bacterium]|nr:ABC transporter substrate-binding protein [Chloroflexota bacterium]